MSCCIDQKQPPEKMAVWVAAKAVVAARIRASAVRSAVRRFMDTSWGWSAAASRPRLSFYGAALRLVDLAPAPRLNRVMADPLVSLARDAKSWPFEQARLLLGRILRLRLT